MRAIVAGLRRLLGSRSAKDDWERTRRERRAALEKLFGPASDSVPRDAVFFHLGGYANVLLFPRHIVGGTLYVTADLTGHDSAQRANERWHQYELAICVRGNEPWASHAIRRLAHYCVSKPLNSGETMNLPSAVPPRSAMTAFLFVEYGELHLDHRRCGVLLCVGITDDELQMCFNEGTTIVLERLRGAGVFPFTDLERETIGGGVA